MTAEEMVVRAAVVLIFDLTLWRVVLQFRIVKLFLRRLLGRYK